MGIPLFLLSVVLTLVLSLVGLVHTIVGAIRYKSGFRYVDTVFLRSARAVDVFGNVAFATFLNDLFIKKGGYHYGNEGETISSATGKNWILGELTFLGLGLAGTLNMLDKDHCWKYIEGDDRQLFRKMGYPGKVKWYYTVSFCICALALLGLLTWFHVWLIL